MEDLKEIQELKATIREAYLVLYGGCCKKSEAECPSCAFQWSVAESILHKEVSKWENLVDPGAKDI